MKIFECKCGSTDVFIEQQGNNCGLYCADCGKWITWLNKDSKRIAERQIQGIEKRIRNKAIDDIVSKINSKVYTPVCVDCLTKHQIIELAEQLKAGEHNA